MTSTIARRFAAFDSQMRNARKPIKCGLEYGTLKAKQTNDLMSHTDTSDNISDEDNQGWRFLKSKARNQTLNSIKSKEKPALSSDEEENTDDLLVVFEATKGHLDLPNTSQSKHSKRQHSKVQNDASIKTKTDTTTSLSRTTATRRKGASSLATDGGATSVSKSPSASQSFLFDDMLMLKDDGKGGVGELSVVSFIEDETTKDVTGEEFVKEEASEIKSVFSSSNLLLSVDDLDQEPESGRTTQGSQKKNHMGGKYETLEDRPSTVSEVDDCLDTEPQPASVSTLHGMNHSVESDVLSVSEANESITSPIPGSPLSPPGPVVMMDEDDNYSDDFDSEPECSAETPSQASLSLIHLAEVTHKDHREKPKKMHSNKLEKQQSSRCSTSFPHNTKRNSPRSVKAHMSVEVQTVWSGDCNPIWTNQSVPVGSNWIPPPNSVIELTQSPLQPKPILPTVVDNKALQTLTEHNPCIVALDNMLKQQVNITRDFLATQRQLHHAISTALNRCLTTDYVTWENTAKLLQSGRSP